MLEEGINEAGAFSAWLALATSYSNNNLPMIHSIFSILCLASELMICLGCGDSRARGFLLGATSGRTTLNGEGLQHQDGHSHILAATIPNCKSYDPCYSYELAAIVHEGINDMYVVGNDRYYYITLMNENYTHPAKPEKLKNEQILKGGYKLKQNKNSNHRILASGVTLNFALEAEKELKKFGIRSDVWSITSFNELYKNGIETERENRLNSTSNKSYVEECFNEEIPTLAVSEYQRAYPNQIREWVKGEYTVLGMMVWKK